MATLTITIPDDLKSDFEQIAELHESDVDSLVLQAMVELRNRIGSELLETELENRLSKPGILITPGYLKSLREKLVSTP